jgi:hypothetical protein
MDQFDIYDKPNLRMMVEGMLYRMRVGCPWRDVPSIFGYSIVLWDNKKYRGFPYSGFYYVLRA